jgi:hypothetical protein
MTAVGMTLLSCCTAPSPPPPPVAYAPPPPVVHAPLPPPVGYAVPPPPAAYSSPPPAQYGNSTYARSDTLPQTAAHMMWRASPRWAAVKTGARISAKKDQQTKFKAAQAKAAKVGVENLTKDDINGLNDAQLKELRGY